MRTFQEFLYGLIFAIILAMALMVIFGTPAKEARATALPKAEKFYPLYCMTEGGQKMQLCTDSNKEYKA